MPIIPVLIDMEFIKIFDPKIATKQQMMYPINEPIPIDNIPCSATSIIVLNCDLSPHSAINNIVIICKNILKFSPK